MGKYEPLAERLGDELVEMLNLTFAEVEETLGFALPPSARKHPSWWGNSYRGNHSQAKGWIGAGWEVFSSDLKAEIVTFRRAVTGEKGGTASTTADLWRQARNLSGIEKRSELEKAVLEEFLYHKAVEGLLALGGTMPDFEVPARERPEL